MINKNKTNLIGIYGIDGSGKSTQISMLRKYFIEKGYIVERPYIMSKSRETLHRISWLNGYESAYELFDIKLLTICGALDVLEDLNNIFKFNINNRVILLDKYKYAFKSIASIHGYQNQEELDLILEQYPTPDLEFFLNINISETEKRILKRDGGTFYNEEVMYLNKYKEQYSDVVDSNKNIYHIDANRNPEEIHSEIIKIIERRHLNG